MNVLMILLAVTVFVVGGAIVLYNSLVSTRNQIRNAFGQIKIQLHRRQDLIPNLAEIVKDTMDFEQKTLQAVIEARNVAVSAKGIDQISTAEKGLSQALGRLLAVVEQYPDLKTNSQVQDLMEALTSTENRIAFARQNYNDSVLSLNNQVDKFPSNLIANFFKIEHEEYLDLPLVREESPSVDLRP